MKKPQANHTRHPHHNEAAGFPSHNEIYRLGDALAHEFCDGAVRKQEEVGKILGLSRQMVHYHERMALGKCAIMARRLLLAEAA